LADVSDDDVTVWPQGAVAISGLMDRELVERRTAARLLREVSRSEQDIDSAPVPRRRRSLASLDGHRAKATRARRALVRRATSRLKAYLAPLPASGGTAADPRE
jgi:hypothetical protein